MPETESERLHTILGLDVRASIDKATAAERPEDADGWRVHAAVSALLLAMLVSGRGVMGAAVWLAWRGGVAWGRLTR